MKKYLTLIILLQLAVTSFATAPSVSPTSDGVDNLRVIESAYLIGSFNDWKLPEGDNLNGAKKMEYGHDYQATHFSWGGELPGGDVSFMIYVPKSSNPTEDDYNGFYTSPCQQFPLYKADTYEHGYDIPFPDPSICKRSAILDISEACMIPDWTGNRVSILFSYYKYDHIFGECFKLGVEGDRRPVWAPDFFSFIASINGGEPKEILLDTLEYGSKCLGCYQGSIRDVTTVSCYFAYPTTFEYPSKYLGACGLDELILYPNKLNEHAGSLYLAAGKDPITINIVGGGELYVELDTLNWTVFFGSYNYGSVKGVSDDTSNQIFISDNTVTVPSPTQIDVYGLGGVKVRSDYGTRLDLGDLGHGTYIVRAGAFSRKVAL